MTSPASVSPSRPLSWRLPAAATVILLLVLHFSGITAALNRSFYDLLQRLQATPANLAPDAVLVLIDENSIEKLNQFDGRRWPWPRDTFAALFAALHQAGAKQILADLIFLEHSEDEMRDALLASYAAACRSVVLAETPEKKQILWPEEYRRKYPGLRLDDRIAIVRHEPDPDGVLRRYSFDGSPAALTSAGAPAGTRWLRWPCNLASLKKERPEQVLSAYSWIRHGQEIMNTAHERLGDSEFEPAFLAAALPSMPVPPGVEAVRGKTVFIGANFAAAYDTKATPLSGAEPGVMYHLAAWSNAERKNWVSDSFLPPLFPALLLCGLILFAGLRDTVGLKTVVGIGSGLFFLIALGSAVLWQQSVYFSPADPALGIVLSFGAVALHNWHAESRRKRQIENLFGSYVSTHVLDNLMAHPEEIRLGGERRELSVYFSDLAGFTDMSEALTPEELLDVVNLYLTEMSPFIIDNRGYLNKYIGDAIMGVFGAPEPLEGHAIAACTAALQSRAHLEQLNARVERERGLHLHARIGINTGEMIAGTLGSDRKVEYTVVGDAVNLASRLEGANKEFGTTILLGEKTAAQLDDRFVLRPVELLRVKGKKKPVQTFELVAWTKELTPDPTQALEHFRAGYAAYQNRNFKKARGEFEIAAKIQPGDNLTRIYADRCAQYAVNPPPPDWDGVFVMTKK
jgi:adenylate cyclase